MKKSLLTIAMAACVAAGNAQEMVEYFGYAFDKMSPNGLWLSQEQEGVVTILDRKADSTYFYGGADGVSYYSEGRGNCWSEDGKLVGVVNLAQCAYWEKGEWHNLPMTEQDLAYANNSVNGITPDGSRIVGSIARGSFDVSNTGMMLAPVYWDKQEDGSYAMYKTLPYPEKDVTGRIPMYVTAVSISDDGKTIAGQVIDYSGGITYPIVYKQDEKGEWSYRTYGKGVVIAADAKLPAWPGEFPQEPFAEDFMNNTDKAAFDEAMDKFYKAEDDYFNGYTDVYPTEPDPLDFFTDATEKEAYLASKDKFEKDLAEWDKLYGAYEEALYAAMTDKNFIFNNVEISADGRYYGSTMSMPNPDADPMAESGAMYLPTTFDVNQEKVEFNQPKNVTDMLLSSVMKDGTMVAGSPAFYISRSSYVINPEQNSVVEFHKYIKEKNNDAAKWLKDSYTFDVDIVVGYDEMTYEPIVETVKDSLVTGTVKSNSEGDIFTSFLFAETDYISYHINLQQQTGVEGLRAENNLNVFAGKAGTLRVEGDVARLSVYDMNGRLVGQFENVNNSTVNLQPNKGNVYLVKLTGRKGQEKVKKFVFK